MTAQYQRAMLLYSQERFADAERELRAFLGEDPTSANGYAMLALCLSHLDRHTEASAEARRAIGYSPDLPFAHYALAVTLFRRNRHDEAVRPLERAIELEPTNPDYWALLAATRLELRQWPSALEAAEHGLSFDPEHVQCNNWRAVALVKLGRKNEAGATIDAALHRSPEDAYTHANQGWTLLHKGQPKQAMLHFREALRLDPNSQWARAGIIEAMKARFFLYRWILAYFLWMARLGSQAQWGILVGGWIGYQILSRYAQQNPQVAPFINPLLVAYVVFAVMTWLAYPLFNLILRVSRFGRLVLNRSQTIESNCIGILLLIALGMFIAGRWVHQSDISVSALFFLMLIIPVSSIFRVEAGWPRNLMITIATLQILFALAIVAAFIAITHLEFSQQRWLDARLDQAIPVFGWSILIVGLGRNYLSGVRVKK